MILHNLCSSHNSCKSLGSFNSLIICCTVPMIQDLDLLCKIICFVASQFCGKTWSGVCEKTGLVATNSICGEVTLFPPAFKYLCKYLCKYLWRGEVTLFPPAFNPLPRTICNNPPSSLFLVTSSFSFCRSLLRSVECLLCPQCVNI